MITRYDDYDLAARNTFRMKVRCALYLELTQEADLLALNWDALPQPVMVMGGGSNLLFTRDFPGTVLHVAITDCHSERSEESVLRTCGAGVVFDDFCAWAAGEGLWGPENLSLIPGECGASAVQNIGAYGVEAKDLLVNIRAFDRISRVFVQIDPQNCQYGYRTSRFKTEWKDRYIITAVTYRLSRIPQPKLDYGGVRKALEARGKAVPSENCRRPRHMSGKPSLATGGTWFSEGTAFPLTPKDIRDTIIDIRRQKLPDPEELGSAGSFFCNPVIGTEHFGRIQALAREENGPEYQVPHYDTPDGIKVPAAWLIDQCGFKGVQNGGAQVYPKQPLVIVNASGNAAPEDIIGLEKRIIDTISAKYGITLHPEVEHI